MKIIIRLFLFALVMLLSASLFAQADTAAVCNATSEVAYASMQLFVFALLGIILHWLVDLKKAKKQSVGTTTTSYIKDTWISSLISLVLCTIIIMARKELTGISYFAMWQGIVIAFVGYVGDSMLPFIFGFAKKAGIDIDPNQ